MLSKTLIAQVVDFLTLVVLFDRVNNDIAKWALDLEQWVRLVVGIVGKSLAVCAEVGVLADAALVAVATDVALVVLLRAKWSIAEDATVVLLDLGDIFESFIQRGKAMTSVVGRRTLVAAAAQIVVGAGKALVPYTNDLLRCGQYGD
jgi:hypothetical protein